MTITPNAELPARNVPGSDARRGLADQQLAGVYKWIPAGVIFTLFGLALMLAWLAEAERRSTLGAAARPSSE